MAIIVGVFSFWMVMLSIIERREDHENTWKHLFTRSDIFFWLYNAPLILLVTAYQYLNTLFLVSSMQDYAKRNYVASLLAEVLEVDIAKKSS